MNIATLTFYFFEVTAALSAVALIFIRNVFYGALLIILCLLSLAGLYILAMAEFLAVTQILVYAGGILVVIIFGIMLTSKIGGKPLVVKSSNWVGGVFAFVSVLTLLLYYLSEETFASPHSGNKLPELNTIDKIGLGLMTDYIIPFEISGILLLIALVGAAVTASSIKSKRV